MTRTPPRPPRRRATALLAVAGLAASFLLVGCSASAFPLQPSTTELPRDAGVVLPTRFVDDIVLVETFVDGRGPFLFVLDTGCSAVLAAPRVADLLPERRRPAGGATARAPDGRDLPVAGALHGLDLRIGDARFAGVGALVMDLSPVEAATGLRLDGILGFPLFVQGILTIDYPAGRVTLARGTLSARDPDAMRVYGGFSPYIDLQVGDARHRVLVDSGFSGALYLAEMPAPSLLVAPPVPWFAATNLAGDTAPTEMARLAVPVRLGSHAVEGVAVSRSGGGSLLGASLLRHFEVAFDARSALVRFRRPSPAPLRFGPRLGFGIRVRMEGDACTVAAVLAGSPADAAGIRPGARIVAVDGIPAGDRPAAALQATLWEAASVALTVEDAAGRRDVSLVAAVLVP